MSLISHVIILLQCIYLCGLSAEKCMDMSNIRNTCLIQYTNKSNLYEKVGMINQYLDNIMSPYFYKYFMQLKKNQISFNNIKSTLSQMHILRPKSLHTYIISL